MNEQRDLIKGPRWQPRRGTAGAALLMTATLKPPVSAVARSDPQARLNDYLDALGFYLGLPDETIDRILFIENTASDLGPLINLAASLPHGKTVEFIGFSGNDHPAERGKAYGEFKLIDHGLAKNSIIAADDIVWKTTGRLKFLNLPEVARSLAKSDFDFAVDLHNVPWVGSRDYSARRHMDLRVFGFRLKAYDVMLRSLWQRKEIGLDAEDLFHAILSARPYYKVVPRFPVQPRLQGISGRHERDYQSRSQRTKDGVRILSRQYLPWLWL